MSPVAGLAPVAAGHLAPFVTLLVLEQAVTSLYVIAMQGADPETFSHLDRGLQRHAMRLKQLVAHMSGTQ